MNYEIPLYSKNPKYTGLPLFYDKAKGNKIWVDNKKYIDFSTNGIGCQMLGYSNFFINYFVKKCINKGNNTSLNNRIIEKLSNLLLYLNPNYDHIRYCNSGGEAIKIAYEIAKEKSSLPEFTLQVGYNGWLIKNNKNIHNIDKINNIKYLNYIPKIVIFELVRHEHPNAETINILNQWQNQGTILILDEITSGFRFNNGGYYSNHDIIPDFVIYGKAISNGYPFACILGKKEMLDSKLWISSTYWSESIGQTAAYYTIKYLSFKKYSYIYRLGKSMMNLWHSFSKFYDIKMDIGKVENIANFEFDNEKNLELKSIFIQEMLKNGILATNQFYPNFTYTKKDFDLYIKALHKTFKIMKRYLNGENIKFKLLERLDK